MSKVEVQEFPWAFLVVGTSQIFEARKALVKHLGSAKRKKVARMPCRPFQYKGRSAVAFYFSVGPGGKQRFKP